MTVHDLDVLCLDLRQLPGYVKLYWQMYNPSSFIGVSITLGDKLGARTMDGICSKFRSFPFKVRNVINDNVYIVNRRLSVGDDFRIGEHRLPVSEGAPLIGWYSARYYSSPMPEYQQCLGHRTYLPPNVQMYKVV